MAVGRISQFLFNPPPCPLFFRPYPQFSVQHKWQLISARLKLVSVHFVNGHLEKRFPESIMQSSEMGQS